MVDHAFSRLFTIARDSNGFSRRCRILPPHRDGRGASAATALRSIATPETSTLPTIMRSVDQIMDSARRDKFFVEFDWMSGSDHPARQRHFEWFRTHGLRWETAAPRGFLEGDPGLYVVHFDGPDDPRVAEYAAKFEDADGMSLDPDAYQMYRLDYASWAEKRGTEGREDEVNDEPL